MKGNSRIHNDDCEAFVKWFIETSKAEGCETCIFLGDWHHHRSSTNVSTMNYTVSNMERLGAAFEKVYVIMGNHDLFYREKREINSMEFIRNIPKFIKFITQANLMHMLEVPKDLPKKPSGPMKDPHIITGFRSKELEDYLTQHNIPLATSISKKTQVLYINDENYSNSKTDKAKELNIPIIVYTNTQELATQLKQLDIIE